MSYFSILWNETINSLNHVKLFFYNILWAGKDILYLTAGKINCWITVVVSLQNYFIFILLFCVPEQQKYDCIVTALNPMTIMSVVSATSKRCDLMDTCLCTSKKPICITLPWLTIFQQQNTAREASTFLHSTIHFFLWIEIWIQHHLSVWQISLFFFISWVSLWFRGYNANTYITHAIGCTKAACFPPYGG